LVKEKNIEPPWKHNSALTVSPVALGVESLPSLPATSSRLVVAMTLVKATALLAGSGQSTRLAVLVDWLGDPVDASITADGLVLRVDEDDFEVFVGGVLVYPVGVQDTQVCATTADTLLGGRTERALILQLVDTLVGRLTVGSTLRSGPLATSAANTDTVDNIALLSLVP